MGSESKRISKRKIALAIVKQIKNLLSDDVKLENGKVVNRIDGEIIDKKISHAIRVLRIYIMLIKPVHEHKRLVTAIDKLDDIKKNKAETIGVVADITNLVLSTILD